MAARSGSGRSATSGRDSAALGEKIQRQIETAEKEKAALRRYEVSSADKLELGMKSSGWTTYLGQLRAELALAKRMKLAAADAIARVWNAKGFKTGYGKVWTARLVKIAKEVVVSAANKPPVAKK